jgi:signal transduction histidine kinase
MTEPQEKGGPLADGPAGAGEEERVLLLARTARDAAVGETVLRQAGLTGVVTRHWREIMAELERGQESSDARGECSEGNRSAATQGGGRGAGPGVLLLPEEALETPEMQSLNEWLARQPPWSDLPVILLTQRGPDAGMKTVLGAGDRSGATPGGAERPDSTQHSAPSTQPLGNVMLLELPVRIATLIAAVQMALRARRRQYQLREQLERERQAQEALREADRRKDEFLAMLAHELRNPLAPLSNALTLLRRAPPDPARLSRLCGMMGRQVEQLRHLVDDLLEVSRITRGKIQLQPQKVELAQLVMRSLESARPLIQAQGHHLSLALPPEPVWLEGDPLRLEQVLGNLLNNATKFTEPGGRIRVSAWTKDGEVTLAVQDNGVGIAPEVLPGIFDLFTQADRSLDRSHGGLGIGLSLVRSLVEMHHGRVEAHSAGLGQGSEFRVHLPRLVEG